MARPLFLRSGALLGLVSLLAVGAAHASSNLLLNLPPIKGESTLKDRTDWSNISSLQWGVGNTVDFSAGPRPVVGNATASSISWTQALDTTYPQLLTALVSPRAVDAQFDVLGLAGGGGKTPAPYLSLKTSTTLVDSVSLSNDQVSGGAAFGKIEMIWDQAALSGGKALKVSTTWDMASNRATTSGAASPSVPLSTVPAATIGGGTRMYLRLDTSDSSAIAGTSISNGYENWIEIDSAQLGAGREVRGLGTDAISGAPSFSELSWSQQADVTLPVLLAHLVNGTVLKRATLDYVKMGNEGPVNFMQMVMEDVVLTGLSLGTGGGDVHSSHSMAFGRFSQTVWAFDEQGQRKVPGFTFAYDVSQGKASDEALKSPSIANFGKGDPGVGAAQQVALPPVGAPIPEPEQWALMLAGLGLMAGIARRRRAVR